MIWEIPGITVGHMTNAADRTGCTVVLAAEPVTASGEVRGSAPATREFALLDPMATVQQIDAVVLSGGSAFGLAAGQGAMYELEAAERGFPTPWGSVPIVVGMSLFDLPVATPGIRPTESDGRMAVREALAGGDRTLGRVGAGTGATVGGWRGDDHAVAGGLVGGLAETGDLRVACLLAVNAWGDVAGHGESHLGEPSLSARGSGARGAGARGSGLTNTTIGVIATNGSLDKVGCQHTARGAHDGLARAINPPHASFDGDAFVAMSAGEVQASIDEVRWLTVKCVDEAIRSLGSAA